MPDGLYSLEILTLLRNRGILRHVYYEGIKQNRNPDFALAYEDWNLRHGKEFKRAFNSNRMEITSQIREINPKVEEEDVLNNGRRIKIRAYSEEIYLRFIGEDQSSKEANELESLALA